LLESEQTITCAYCGVICKTDCKAYGSECEGCLELAGKVPWAPFYNSDTCPIYACVTKKGYRTCAKCGKAPCAIWLATRNPEISDAEFDADINNRLKNLSSL